MPKYTEQEIKKELGLLDERTPAAKFYLEKELERRTVAGRPNVSGLTRREQNRRNQQKFRDRKKTLTDKQK